MNKTQLCSMKPWQSWWNDKSCCLRVCFLLISSFSSIQRPYRFWFCGYSGLKSKVFVSYPSREKGNGPSFRSQVWNLFCIMMTTKKPRRCWDDTQSSKPLMIIKTKSSNPATSLANENKQDQQSQTYNIL